MSNKFKFNELSFELYAKNTDKRVLAEGPSNVKFWVKKSLAVKMMCDGRDDAW